MTSASPDTSPRSPLQAGACDHAHLHTHTHVNIASAASTRALWIALALTGGFAIVEAAGGIAAGSLALISDAGHMVTDTASFVIALIAAGLARRPPSRSASFGYARAEVLAAFVNAMLMLALVVWIAVEAVERLQAPIPVAGPIVILVGAGGMAVNIVVAVMLIRAGGNINVRGALLHVVGDLLGSVAALVAGSVIYFTGWMPIDPILSIAVALLILRSTLALLRQSIGVLMERVPAHLSYEKIGDRLAQLPEVRGIHDLHVWYLSADRVALSAHVVLVDGDVWPATLAAAQKMLVAEFGIDHATLQPSWPAPPRDGRVIPLSPAPASGGSAAGPHRH